MRLYLATWPADYGVSKGTKFVGGDVQWETFMQLFLAMGNPAPSSNVSPSALSDAMRLYLAMAGPTSQGTGFMDIGQVQRGEVKLRMLLSYHYYKTQDLDVLIPKYFSEPYPDILLDSGAWSAFTQGVHVSTQQYIDYVKRFKHWFTVYSNLDDMTNPENTLRNQKTIEDAGLQPFPVFHTGEPWNYLEKYIENYTYMALGKIIPYTNNPDAIMPWVTKAFKMAKGRTVFHGFGVTNWLLLRSFPWYSADSSSWGAGFRFGRVPIFDPKRGRFFAFNLGDHRECYKYDALIRSYGFHPTDFANREKNDRNKVCAIAALSYVAAENYLRKHHGEVKMVIDQQRKNPVLGGSGANLYLADSDPAYLGAADKGVKVYLADGSADNLGRGDAGLKVYLAGEKPEIRSLGQSVQGEPSHINMKKE